jgi:hypothetical protein
MNAYEKIEKLGEKEFKLITGVTREVFWDMLGVLIRKYEDEHVKGGQPGMAVELRLTLALEYWREYRTFRHMANDHQISRTEINRAVLWVENTLSESEEFKLTDIKARFAEKKEDEEEGEDEAEILLIDVTEQPIERPKYEQERAYSGKKNAHDKTPNLGRRKK